MYCCYHLASSFYFTLEHLMQLLLDNAAWAYPSRSGGRDSNGDCSICGSKRYPYLNGWATRASILTLWNIRWSTTINLTSQGNHFLLHLLKHELECCIIIVFVLLDRTLSDNGWNKWHKRSWGWILWVWLVNWLCKFPFFEVGRKRKGAKRNFFIRVGRLGI